MVGWIFLLCRSEVQIAGAERKSANSPQAAMTGTGWRALVDPQKARRKNGSLHGMLPGLPSQNRNLRLKPNFLPPSRNGLSASAA
jgi:hypothetical protein